MQNSPRVHRRVLASSRNVARTAQVGRGPRSDRRFAVALTTNVQCDPACCVRTDCTRNRAIGPWIRLMPRGRLAPIMRRFEFVEGTSAKFWQIEQKGSVLHIGWGRVGA